MLLSVSAQSYFCTSAMYSVLSSPLAARPINNLSPVSRPKKVAALRNSVQPEASAAAANRNAALAVGRSLYEILRVEKTASLKEIKAAYRSLAKVYHPDVMGPSSDGREFIEIRKAYETLKDPTTKAMYDMSLAERARSVGLRVFPTRTWETDQCW